MDTRLRKGSGTIRVMKSAAADEQGLTLIELVVTICIILVLTAAVLPLSKISIKRAKELDLRRNLRITREAIDDFHRSYIASQMGPMGRMAGGVSGGSMPGRPSQPMGRNYGGTSSGFGRSPYSGSTGGFGSSSQSGGYGTGSQGGYGRNPSGGYGTTQPGGIGTNPMGGVGTGTNQPFGSQTDAQGNIEEIPLIDISRFDPVDCKGYPPTLDVLVEGVPEYGSPDQKVKFLRRIPRDPMTEDGEWGFRSYQDTSDSLSWGRQNVYDVYSQSSGIALDGTKYKDW